MASFFEKLKKGMKIEVPPEEKIKEKPKKEGKIAPERVEEIEEKKEIKISGERKEGFEIRKEKWFEREGELAVDVYQTEEELVIQSAIAGVKPETLDIAIESDVITIRGDRKKLEEKGEKNYFYQECYWGPFSRQIIAPVEIDPSRAQAVMKEGILTIRMPKIQREKKRKIEIKEQ